MKLVSEPQIFLNILQELWINFRKCNPCELYLKLLYVFQVLYSLLS